MLKEEDPVVGLVHPTGHAVLVPALLLNHLPGDDGLLAGLGQVGIDCGQGEVRRDIVRRKG